MALRKSSLLRSTSQQTADIDNIKAKDKTKSKTKAKIKTKSKEKAKTWSEMSKTKAKVTVVNKSHSSLEESSQNGNEGREGGEDGGTVGVALHLGVGYFSDSEMLDLDHLKTSKNKSNLYLIKSLSLIDKNNFKNDLSKFAEDFEKDHFNLNKMNSVNTINALMLEPANADQVSSKPLQIQQNPNNNQQPHNLTQNSSKNKKKFNKSSKKMNKNVRKSSLSKQETNNSMTKSTQNEEDFNDLKDLLRRPSKANDGPDPDRKLNQKKEKTKKNLQNKRPKSLPAKVENKLDSSLNMKILETTDSDNNQNPVPFKRESFLRQSFQSIRRSLSSYKRYANIQHASPSIVSNYSSFSTSSSSCSTTSCTAKTTTTTQSSSSASSPISFPKTFSSFPSSPSPLSNDSEGNLKCDPLSEESDFPDLNANKNSLDVAIYLNDNLSPLHRNSSLNPQTIPLATTITTTTIKNSSSATTTTTTASTSLMLDKEIFFETTLAAPTSYENPEHASKQKLEQNGRSTSSVSTLSYTQSDINSMAPLQNRADAQSDLCLNTIETSEPGPEKEVHPSTQKRPYIQQLSLPESIPTDYTTASNSSIKSSFNNLTTLGNSKSEAKSLRQSSSSLNPLVPVSSTSSIRSLSSNGSSTAKNDQNSSAAANNAASSTISAATEKEKKRKEVSSSRVKKFHRHFTQVSKDEKLINYFSCALVSDILLQGHLYITDQHFAFYSNVFGYVTKVVIPTSSVTKISKEKTAKIIPNAVGVATADERHVFGSFISREAAFRLMCSVCPPMAPVVEIIKSPAELDICEEFLMEDDSSCSISGNESPPQLATGTGTAGAPESKSPKNSEKIKFNPAGDLDIPKHNTKPCYLRSSTPDRSPSRRTNLFDTSTPNDVSKDCSEVHNSITSNIASASTSDSQSQSTSSEPTTVTAKSNSRQLDCLKKISSSICSRISKATSYFSSLTDLQLIYFGIMLAVILSFFSFFLLYRVINIEAKASLYGSPVDHPFHYGNDEDIFKEALRWQKELQKKSTEEAQSILESNLKQIAKVRRSLETLSMLISERSTASGKTKGD